MWANAQRDGRPAEHRWRPLFNAAKFGWRPLLECRAVTLPRRDTRWNLQGCPKLPNQSQKYDRHPLWDRWDKLGEEERKKKEDRTRMWANAQPDGRPAKRRWRPLFNAAKFGWRSPLDCRAVTLPRCETSWNLQWCPKLVNRSQPLVGRSSPYREDMWRRYCCLTSFFSDCRYVP